MAVEMVRIKKEYLLDTNSRLIDEAVLSELEKEIENATKLLVKRDGNRIAVDISDKDSVSLSILVEKKSPTPYIEVIASSNTYEPVYENTKNVFNAADKFFKGLGLKEKIF